MEVRGRDARVCGGVRDQEDAARQQDSPRADDRMRTRVVALVFPQCSLAGNYGPYRSALKAPGMKARAVLRASTTLRERGQAHDLAGVANAELTAASTKLAASSVLTCSHMRTTCQPAVRSRSSLRRSRSTLRWSFGSQYAWLTRGLVPCSGQACQKQPSRKTAIFTRGKTTSGRTSQPSPRTAAFLRKRNPRRCSSLRSRASGRLPVFRFPLIVAETAGLDGWG
jgi:hypothetical protein